MNSKYSFKSQHFQIQMRFKLEQIMLKKHALLSEFLSFYMLTAYMLILFLNVVHYEIKPSQNRPCAAQNSFVYLR